MGHGTAEDAGGGAETKGYKVMKTYRPPEFEGSAFNCPCCGASVSQKPA